MKVKKKSVYIFFRRYSHAYVFDNHYNGNKVKFIFHKIFNRVSYIHL